MDERRRHTMQNKQTAASQRLSGEEAAAVRFPLCAEKTAPPPSPTHHVSFLLSVQSLVFALQEEAPDDSLPQGQRSEILRLRPHPPAVYILSNCVKTHYVNWLDNNKVCHK